MHSAYILHTCFLDKDTRIARNNYVHFCFWYSLSLDKSFEHPRSPSDMSFQTKLGHLSFGNTFPNAMEFCERMPFTAMPLAKGRQRWVFDLPEADFAPHRKDGKIVLKHLGFTSRNMKNAGGFKHFSVHPYLGKMNPIWPIFLNGLKPPN